MLFEWELAAESWTDQHPHSDYNFVIEGQLAVIAFYDYLCLGLSIPAVQSTRVDPSGVMCAWLLLSVLFMTVD